MTDIFKKLDNWDWILGIEELEKASLETKRLIAEQFEKKYEGTKFWEPYCSLTK